MNTLAFQSRYTEEVQLPLGVEFIPTNSRVLFHDKNSLTYELEYFTDTKLVRISSSGWNSTRKESEYFCVWLPLEVAQKLLDSLTSFTLERGVNSD